MNDSPSLLMWQMAIALWNFGERPDGWLIEPVYHVEGNRAWFRAFGGWTTDVEINPDGLIAPWRYGSLGKVLPR